MIDQIKLTRYGGYDGKLGAASNVPRHLIPIFAKYDHSIFEQAYRDPTPDELNRPACFWFDTDGKDTQLIRDLVLAEYSFSVETR